MNIERNPNFEDQPPTQDSNQEGRGTQKSSSTERRISLPFGNHQDRLGTKQSGEKNEDDIKRYYENFLKKAHPEYDAEMLRIKIEAALADDLFKKFICLSKRLHDEIQAEHPDWNIDEW